MATIVYLDADDEITSAATRIRTADAARIGLVLPFGSRVATSRINFRLLAREAQANGRRLDIVAPDASARALAASAGLPVFASVAEYEAALDGGLDQEDAGAGASAAAGAVAASAAMKATEGTVPLPPAEAAGTAAGAAAGRSWEQVTPLDPGDQAQLDEIVGRSRQPPVARPRRRGPGGRTIAGLFALALALGLVVVAGATAAVLVLPTADITVTPRIEPVGPIAITITADPRVTAVDPDAVVIPAQTLDIPVEVSGEFPATGKRVEETRAKGKVRWTNCDPTAAYTIRRGTIVKTSGGTSFATAEQVLLSVAGLSGSPPKLTVRCTTNDVDVTAVEPGKDGNVAAGAIKVVPARYNRKVISVTNPVATKGGSRQEFPRVSRKDVDAALAALEKDLAAQFATELENPELAPPGTTVFPETAVAGEPVPTVDPATLVGQEVESFTLGLTATGTVLAVDEGPIEAIAEAQLAEAVDEGYELVEGSMRIQVGEGTVTEGLVDFPVIGSARQVRPLDAAALELAVLGLTETEAAAVLAPYGDAVIVLWPGWVTSVPNLDQRVTLIVAEPVDVTPEPTPNPTPSPTTEAVPSPEPGASDDVPGNEPVPSG
jgi:hypothetical protein